jgi:GH24 family phage-related lysozyme (muramidase)
VLDGHLGEYLNDGDFDATAGQFDVWIYITLPDGTKEKSDGLITRRAAEKKLFLTPVEEPATHNID